MAAPEKQELEVMLKRQQGLLAQVQSGALQLKDGGEKIQRKIQELQQRLQDSPGASKKTTAPTGLQQRQQRLDSSRKQSAASSMQINESSVVAAKDNQSHPDDVDGEQTRDEQRVSKNPKVSLQSEGKTVASRTYVRDGKTVRLRSGSLEPVREGLPGGVVRQTAERVRAQLAEEVEATASQLGELLTIQEGDPMDAAPTDEPMNETTPKKGVQRYTRPRTTKLISMEEAAQLEREQADAYREVEDRILSRRPPPHPGPYAYFERGYKEQDETFSEDSDYESSDLED